ncbi:MAG: response regulator transcription factor [Bacillota bacterium]
MTQSPSLTSTRVLIVDDEPRMRELLQRALASWGWEPSVVKTAEEALRVQESNPVPIILLDLNLPGLGGMDCFEQIHQRWPSTQVIILTGFGDLESARRAIHLDVVEFLTKPCHLGELENALDRARRRLAQLNPPSPQRSQPSPPPPPDPASPATLEELERQHILATLARHQGNRTATAAELGISLRTLYYRLAEYQQQGHDIGH